MRTITLLDRDWYFLRQPVAPDQAWVLAQAEGEPVVLPHTWNAADGQSGDGGYYRGCCTYVRRFPAEPNPGGQVWAEFRGANSSADVYLNGTALGHHDGGYSTFRIDLTQALAEDNLLVVQVDNSPNQTVYPQMADFTFYGGLYRAVHLITLPAAHFALDQAGGPGVALTPVLEGNRARVQFQAAVSDGQAVRCVIEDAATVAVVEGQATVAGGQATGEIIIENVHLWQGRDDPYLYQARFELLEGDQVADQVEFRFGCREFAVDPGRGFLLNGRPYPLRGVSRHQDWLGVGNAITTEMMATDINLLVELGATTVRLAHYQHDQHFYDLCDEMGIVVWAEIPQISDWLPLGTANAESQLTELILQNRHHASIACWGLSNELSLTGVPAELIAEHQRLNSLAHRLDPSRLTTMANLFLLETDSPLVSLPDVMSYNLYFGWYVGEVEDNESWLADFHRTYPDIAIGLSEYGADANPAYQTATPERGDYSEQYQARYHEYMADLIDRSPYLWATHVWNLADFGAAARNEGGQPGRNQKGLVTFDRSIKKDAFYVYKAHWSKVPFVHLAGRRYAERVEAVSEITVYSNQPEVELYCDGQLVASLQGSHVFRFAVPLTGQHQLTARSGEATDTISVRKVASPNPGYVLAATPVTNWFANTAAGNEGFFSIHDTVGDICSTPEGAGLIGQLMEQMAAGRTGMAANVSASGSVQQIINRWTLARLLSQSGVELSEDHVTALNAALNRIPKPTNSTKES